MLRISRKLSPLNLPRKFTEKFINSQNGAFESNCSFSTSAGEILLAQLQPLSFNYGKCTRKINGRVEEILHFSWFELLWTKPFVCTSNRLAGESLVLGNQLTLSLLLQLKSSCFSGLLTLLLKLLKLWTALMWFGSIFLKLLFLEWANLCREEIGERKGEKESNDLLTKHRPSVSLCLAKRRVFCYVTEADDIEGRLGISALDFVLS